MSTDTSTPPPGLSPHVRKALEFELDATRAHLKECVARISRLQEDLTRDVDARDGLMVKIAELSAALGPGAFTVAPAAPRVLATEDEFDAFLEAAGESVYLVATATHTAVLLFSNEDGDWFGLRPLDEDDSPPLLTPAPGATGGGILLDLAEIRAELPVTVLYPAVTR